jgi:uncharacterized circularly permuted ATP-grasp superfamily protein
MTGTPVGKPQGILAGYDPASFFCEMMRKEDQGAPQLAETIARLQALDPKDLRRRVKRVDQQLFNLGITFTVYSDSTAIDRVLPFDMIPRVLLPEEWAKLEAGVKQRVAAINLFLADVYGPQKILKDGIVPKDIVLGNVNYRPEIEGMKVPCGTYAHICGIDVVRGDDGVFLILEDNARTPSGVSYVIENRNMMMRMFPDLMATIAVRPVLEYGQRLRGAMTEIAPEGVDDPQIVLLSPGIYNSAYFEHVFLAREMGVPLVQGADLVVENDRVYMRTVGGLRPVHSIYRRLNDDFLDPLVFRPDSMLGVPGLIGAWKKGNVAIANAIGTGVADDKAVYAYMPRIIRYYLGEDAILPNVETHICREPDALAYTLDHIEELVVKPVGESGGYGMIVGPHASRKQIAEFKTKLKRDPANYISQPMIRLSVSPTLTKTGVSPRHVDLRPFAVTGKSTWVLPGGLTRVALKRGSIVVNSSQGGGSKDTWVLQ